MIAWPDTRLLKLFGIELPILQAPMAGASGSALAIAVGNAGGLPSLPCAMLSPTQIREEVALIRAGTRAPLNLNFFCHQNPDANPQADDAWKALLKPTTRNWARTTTLLRRPRAARLSTMPPVRWLKNSGPRSSVFISACLTRVCCSASKRQVPR